MFDNYHQNQKLILPNVNSIYLYLNGSKYYGTGVLNWNPIKGFLLDFIYSNNISSNSKKQHIVTAQSIVKKRNNWFKPEYYNWAVAKIYIPDNGIYDLSIHWNKSFELNINSMLFCRTVSSKIDDSFKSEVFFKVSEGARLFDSVNREEHIGNKLNNKSMAVIGIDVEDKENISILGKITDQNYLNLKFTLNKTHWPEHKNSWDIAEAFQYAMCFHLNERISILYRKSNKKANEYLEINKEEDPKSFGNITLLPSKYSLSKTDLIKITEFFLRNDKKSKIIKVFLNRLLEAGNQT